MAYPTSVFSPASRSNGQTIDASHVNDLQTEVTAIENELLGTITGSLNVSGASTLATLRATNSTLTTLNVTGGSTLTTLQAAGSTFSVRPVTPPPDAVLVFLESTAAIGSSAASTLAFTAQSFAINSSLHSTGTNPSRLTPQSTGVYRMHVQLTIAGITSATNTIQAQIRDSSGTILAEQHAFASTNAGFTYSVTAYKRFDVTGGYAQCILNTGGLSTLSLSSGFGTTWFAMHKL